MSVWSCGNPHDNTPDTIPDPAPPGFQGSMKDLEASKPAGTKRRAIRLVLGRLNHFEP